MFCFTLRKLHFDLLFTQSYTLLLLILYLFLERLSTKKIVRAFMFKLPKDRWLSSGKSHGAEAEPTHSQACAAQVAVLHPLKELPRWYFRGNPSFGNLFYMLTYLVNVTALIGVGKDIPPKKVYSVKTLATIKSEQSTWVWCRYDCTNLILIISGQSTLVCQ